MKCGSTHRKTTGIDGIYPYRASGYVGGERGSFAFAFRATVDLLLGLGLRYFVAYDYFTCGDASANRLLGNFIGSTEARYSP